MSALTHAEIISKSLHNSNGIMILFDKGTPIYLGRPVAVAQNCELEFLLEASLLMYQTLNDARKLFTEQVDALEASGLHSFVPAVMESVTAVSNVLTIAEIGGKQFAELMHKKG